MSRLSNANNRYLASRNRKNCSANFCSDLSIPSSCVHDSDAIKDNEKAIVPQNIGPRNHRALSYQEYKRQNRV